MERQEKFRITKKIAKHGKQAILVIPTVLQKHLRPGTIVEATIGILEEVENE